MSGANNKTQNALDSAKAAVRALTVLPLVANPMATQQIATVKSVLKNGTNADIPPQARRTALPPENEKPIYVLSYSDMATGHVAAFYDGERVDLYPESIDRNSNDVASMINIVFGDDVNKKFRPQSHQPDDRNDIQCYAIYPSQLGIRPPERIKQVMRDIREHRGDYQLYQNNCADQVTAVFARLGVDMSESRGPLNIGLPSNVRNFAHNNGYEVPYDCIPFTTEQDPHKIYEYHAQRADNIRSLQEQYTEFSRTMESQRQANNPTSVRESTNCVPKIPDFTPIVSARRDGR